MFIECTFIVIRSALAGEILKNILTYLLTNKEVLKIVGEEK